MGYIDPPTFTTGALTASQLNILSTNLRETAVAKATTTGQYFVSNGPNSLVARLPISAAIDTVDTTSTTTFTDLDSSIGPTVTTATGTRALVAIGSTASNNTAFMYAYQSYEVSGASTISASLNRATNVRSASSNVGARITALYLEQSLTAGTNTFTCKYLAGSGGQAAFSYRSIIVVAF